MTAHTPGALEGVQVVEFGRGVAVAYCGALLAACGADVVKIEPREVGDAVRRLPPFSDSATAPESSGMHAFLNANKRSITLDLDAPGDCDAARQLDRGRRVDEAHSLR